MTLYITGLLFGFLMGFAYVVISGECKQRECLQSVLFLTSTEAMHFNWLNQQGGRTWIIDIIGLLFL